MNKKIIGYQIAKYSLRSNTFSDVLNDLFSFVVWRHYYNAISYVKSISHIFLYKIVPIYEDDVENPVFYEDLRPSVKAKRIENIETYFSTLPNVQVSYINERQGQIYFDGVVRSSFLEELKEKIDASDIYVTYLPAMVAPGVAICFNFGN